MKKLTENQKGLLTDVFSLANQPAYKFQSVLNFSNLTTQTQNEMIDREFKNIKEFQVFLLFQFNLVF